METFFSPGWIVAATWQFTVVASLFVFMLFGRPFPKRIWLFSLLVFLVVLLVNLSRAQLEGVYLLLPVHGGDGPTLEIFSYRNMHASPPTMANHTGFTHIAFSVDDVRQTLQTTVESGGTTLGEITEREVAGVGVLTFVYFRDPEGNIVEIQSWRK